MSVRISAGLPALLAVFLIAACGGRSSERSAEGAKDASGMAAESTAASMSQASAPSGKTEPAPATASRQAEAAPPKATGEAKPTTTTAPKREATPTSKETPASRPAARPKPERVTVVAPAGTELHVTLNQELSTRTSSAGDAFTATVMQPVTVADRVVVPANATVHGVVTAVQQPEGERPAVIKLDFTRIEMRGKSRPLHATLAEAKPEKKSTTSTGGAIAKIGGGAAAGAILGRIIGKNATGTLIGAAVGAAAGTAIVLGTKDSYGVLAKDSPMTLRLEEALEVTVAR